MLLADTTHVSATRSTAKLVVGTLAVGGALFVAVRWGVVGTESGLVWPSVAWLALPLLLTYVGAAAIGLILLRDGITRWWWMPATVFVLLGLPVESWVSSRSLLATGFGSFAGSVFDLLLVLAPGAVLASRARRTRTSIHDRIVPAVGVVGVALVSAMRVGLDGPDVSLSVGLAILTFGFCSQSTSWRRAACFVAIALSLGADVPGSFVNSISQGNLEMPAIVDASMDVALAVLAYAIAPLALLWSHLLSRRAARLGSAAGPATV